MADRHIYRAPWHDYRSRCIYMVTMSKNCGVEPFGSLAGNWRIPTGQPGSVVVRLSATGAVVRRSILAIPTAEPAVRILQYSIMPDHVHILLFVTREIKAPLGHVIAAMKAMATQGCGGKTVFAPGFNDQILKQTRSLDTIFRYIRENPYRLAVRRANPDYFRRVNRLMLCGMELQAYGNLQLLDNPWKEAVVVHRADTDAKKSADRELWLYTAANGGVLISPFISQAERSIRREAEALYGKTILLTNDAFPDRYKPAAHDFTLCESGRLLILAPAETLAPCRRTFLRLNALAGKLAFRGG